MPLNGIPPRETAAPPAATPTPPKKTGSSKWRIIAWIQKGFSNLVNRISSALQRIKNSFSRTPTSPQKDASSIKASVKPTQPVVNIDLTKANSGNHVRRRTASPSSQQETSVPLNDQASVASIGTVAEAGAGAGFIEPSIEPISVEVSVEPRIFKQGETVPKDVVELAKREAKPEHSFKPGDKVIRPHRTEKGQFIYDIVIEVHKDDEVSFNDSPIRRLFAPKGLVYLLPSQENNPANAGAGAGAGVEITTNAQQAAKKQPQDLTDMGMRSHLESPIDDDRLELEAQNRAKRLIEIQGQPDYRLGKSVNVSDYLKRHSFDIHPKNPLALGETVLFEIGKVYTYGMVTMLPETIEDSSIIEVYLGNDPIFNFTHISAKNIRRIAQLQPSKSVEAQSEDPASPKIQPNNIDPRVGTEISQREIRGALPDNARKNIQNGEIVLVFIKDINKYKYGIIKGFDPTVKDKEKAAKDINVKIDFGNGPTQDFTLTSVTRLRPPKVETGLGIAAPAAPPKANAQQTEIPTKIQKDRVFPEPSLDQSQNSPAAGAGAGPVNAAGVDAALELPKIPKKNDPVPSQIVERVKKESADHNFKIGDQVIRPRRAGSNEFVYDVVDNARDDFITFPLDDRFTLAIHKNQVFHLDWSKGIQPGSDGEVTSAKEVMGAGGAGPTERVRDFQSPPQMSKTQLPSQASFELGAEVSDGEMQKAWHRKPISYQFKSGELVIAKAFSGKYYYGKIEGIKNGNITIQFGKDSQVYTTEAQAFVFPLPTTDEYFENY